MPARADSAASPLQVDALVRDGPYPLPDLGGTTVLLVDHVREDRGIVASMLDLTGAGVREVGLAGEATETIPLLRPDAVITEMELPDGTGIDLVRFIRAHDRKRDRWTVVIALTWWSGQYPCEMARQAGFDGYFTKPPTTDDLAVGLAALLAAHRKPRSVA